MITKTRVKFLVTGVVVSIVLVLSAFRLVRFLETRDHRFERMGSPVQMTANWLNQIPVARRSKALESMYERSPMFRWIPMKLVQQDGHVIFPYGAYSKVNIGELPDFVHRGGPPGPPPGGPGMGPEHDNPIEKIALEGQPPQYLVVQMPRPHPEHDSFRKRFIIATTVLTAALTLGIFATIAFMLFYFRGQARTMDRVIYDLKHGRLNSRISINRADELSRTMLKFNEMADEIESLVTTLRRSESSRRQLMSELTHDLRTPIASMRNATETILEMGDKLPPEKHQQLLRTSLTEAEYLSGLVDDLLFLSDVVEPNYRKEVQRINLFDLIQKEAFQLEELYDDIQWTIQEPQRPYVIEGDRRLLRRLFRNALQNAFSYATSTIEVSFVAKNGNIHVCITDDGPGFSREDLTNYGERKFSRALHQKSNQISIGLGSVIMASIASMHDGTILPGNCPEGSPLCGALVQVVLPEPDPDFQAGTDA